LRDRTNSLFKLFTRHLRWVAVSPVAAEFLATTGLAPLEDIGIVPNPIDPKRLGEGPTVHDGPLRICYLSDSDTNKGFRLLPDVIRATAELPLEWHLFVNEREDGTNADTWKQLRELRTGGLRFHKPNLNVAEVYRGCDIVFVPSHVESFGRIVAESMTLGIPVVASENPAFRWLLGDKEAGLLFDVGDPVSAAGAVGRVVADPGLQYVLGEEGKRRAAAFVPERVAALMLEQYGSAAGSRWEP